MRVLILGGTVFLGRHVVDDALRRGHELTLFTRGKHGTGPTGSNTSLAIVRMSRRCAAVAGTPQSRRQVPEWCGGTRRPDRGAARQLDDIAAWLEHGGERELDDWRVEYRPPRMSAEREAALLRLARSA